MSDSELLNDFISFAAEEISSLNNPSFGEALNSIENKPALQKKNKKSSKSKDNLSLIHTGDTDSSDDEDNRDFENNKYNDSGKHVKDLLNHNQVSVTSTALQQKITHSKSPWTPKGSVQHNQAPVKFEPVFGIRVVNPLVSTKLLEERMTGREVVPLIKLKMFVRSVSESVDWVVAGVIVSKGPTKTSQNGKNFCAWTLSDLKSDLRTVTLLLFSGAHKELWKSAVGTVIGILNPTVMDLREGSKDEACLSVYNHQRVMIIGQSKDLGTCKSLKKNGERCTLFVNTSSCEYCLYHVKQEYQKVSKRSDLQSGFSGGGLTALRNKVLGKDQVFYAGKLYTSIPAKKSVKQQTKDAHLLRGLSGQITLKRTIKKVNPLQKHAVNLELSAAQRQKDSERLKMLGLVPKVNDCAKNFDGVVSKDVTLAESKNLALSVIDKLKSKKEQSSSRLSDGSMFAGEKQQVGLPAKVTEPVSSSSTTNDSQNLSLQQVKATKQLSFLGVPVLTKSSKIDLSAPVRKKQVVRAKQNALTWVQNNGSIKKVDPNNTKGTNKGKKRALEALNDMKSKKSKVDGIATTDPCLKKIQENEFFSDRFKKMMAASSSHTDLLEQRDDEEQEKYFKKLEMKERMEEKMCSTYKMACKAVRCLKCKYTSFSASDLCKQEKHPLKVFDAIKRFFKCGNCNNRTVSLTFVPTDACKNCGSGKWEKTTMMKERIVSIGAPKLSIRGGEQTFVNSVMADGNLDLLVPDS